MLKHPVHHKALAKYKPYVNLLKAILKPKQKRKSK
jgi:hypothetical protein